MGKFWLKVWLWIKLGVLVLIFIYVLAFSLQNYASPVKVWYSYKKTIDTNALVLSSMTFIGGIVFAILARTTIVTIRQFRELKERNRTDKLHRDVADMKLKASMLTPKPPGDSPAET
jgi:uncharacterized integral membrane protein